MAVPQKNEERLMTGEDLARRPDLNPCELVNGRVVPMAPAGHIHGAAESRLDLKLALWAEETVSRPSSRWPMRPNRIGGWSLGSRSGRSCSTLRDSTLPERGWQHPQMGSGLPQAGTSPVQAGMSLSPAGGTPPPACTSDCPACTSDSPICTSDSPACTSDSPTCTSDSPTCTSDSPACTSDSPLRTSVRPACTAHRYGRTSHSSRCTSLPSLCTGVRYGGTRDWYGGTDGRYMETGDSYQGDERSAHHVRRNGWASVLKTTLSRSSVSSGAKSR